MGKRTTGFIYRNKVQISKDLQYCICQTKTGRFHLYSDTSKYVTGSALYQIQNGKPKLIAYASKRLPEAVKNYSITELELCGLAISIAKFCTFT